MAQANRIPDAEAQIPLPGWALELHLGAVVHEHGLRRRPSDVRLHHVRHGRIGSENQARLGGMDVVSASADVETKNDHRVVPGERRPGGLQIERLPS